MGKCSISAPINPEQIRLALPGGFIARADDAAGTVTVEADGMTDAQVQAAVGGIVYDPAVQPAEVANTVTIEDRLGVALDQLRAFVDASKPTTAASQASAGYDAAKLCARVLVGLVRLRLRRLDSAD